MWSNLVAWVTKYAILLVLVIIVILVLIGWLWWNNHENAKNAAAVPKAQAIVNKAQANAGSAAVQTVTGNQTKNEATDAKLPPIINNYNTYPAAKVAVDPAFFAAFDASLCVYRSAANLPQCQRLQQLDTK